MAYCSTKTYGADRGLSCALRQWAATSHCQLLHGYSLGFKFTFAAEQLDARGWVVDFGTDGFGPIRQWLHTTFDHTLLVAQDDPARPDFDRLGKIGLADVRVVPGTSCEHLAAYVFSHTGPMIDQATGGRCWIASVECFEHGANSAIYENPQAVLRNLSTEVMRTVLNAVAG